MSPLTQSKKAAILSLLVTPVFACLTLSASVQADTQDSWRGCGKCNVMFFDGFPNKGRCAAGGDHVAQGFNFILPYNAPETKQAQAAWRYCDKRHAMFYDGYPNKGRRAVFYHQSQCFLLFPPVRLLPPSRFCGS